MKRFVVVLLICLMYCGIAYSEDNKTILFRDIPWGVTIDDVEKTLLKDSIEVRANNESYGGYNHMYSSIPDIMLMNKNFKEKYDNFMFFRTYSPLKVAGYDVYSTYGYFAYLPDENNIITKERKLTSFMLGGYEIIPNDMDYATEDLIEKLKSIYGEYDNTWIYKSAYKFTLYIWRSETDESFLTLIRIDSTYATPSRIYIYYGTFEGNDLIDTARKLQEEYDKKIERKNSQSGGTDGL